MLSGALKSFGVEPLVEAFDCGREELNRYLLRYAWQNQQAGASQTYVGMVGDAIVGFYTLAVGQVMHEEAPERLSKGLAKHPIPIMLLARLAVDRRLARSGRGQGAAAGCNAAHLAGGRYCRHPAFAVHAKNEKPSGFMSISTS